MHSRPYVICVTQPFEKKPYLLIGIGEEVCVKREILDILEFPTIVAYGFESNSDILGPLVGRRLPTIIDVQTAEKLLSGRPKSDFPSGKEPWTLKNILGRNGVSPATLRWLNEIDQLRTIAPEKQDDFDDRARELVIGFERAWRRIEDELEKNDEIERFFEIEVPAFNLFLEAQIAGIGLSQDALKQKLQDLKSTYYSSIKKLEFEYGFLSQNIKPNMSWEDIKEHCQLRNIADEIDYDFWQYVDIYAEDDDFLGLLLRARNSYMDYTALLRYCVSAYKKIHPQFDVLGTVTGRILIRRPGIQYLKKTSRDIFAPEDGNVFLYADFDQFEPGIIASFSKDKKLIDLYNNGDIYEGLSLLLFGTVEKRKIAKIIFLSFIYGMSQERLGKLILDSTQQEAMREQGMLFFREFEVLGKWKQTACEEAKQRGYASSLLGNRRYVAERGQLSAKESRWVPNQIIQGTASYIFKKALIELRRRIAYVKLLVPMHDAILVEVKKGNEEEAKKIIQEVFSETYKAVCPDIQPGVSFEGFAA